MRSVSKKIQAAARILSLATGANVRLVGSQATGTARPNSDYDMLLDMVSDQFDATLLESAGWRSAGSCVISPRMAALAQKPMRIAWTRIRHFEHTDGTKLDVWLEMPPTWFLAWKTP